LQMAGLFIMALALLSKQADKNYYAAKRKKI
jgi:hypothetical protein